MTTESFLGRLKNWEQAGFIHSEVWSHMDYIVDPDIRRSIETGGSISSADGFEKLTEDDTIPERVLSCASRFIVASRRLQFALEILRLEYQVVKKRNAFGHVKMRSNLEVCHQYNICLFISLVLLLRYKACIIFGEKVEYLIVK